MLDFLKADITDTELYRLMGPAANASNVRLVVSSKVFKLQFTLKAGSNHSSNPH
jgi:hypothetical protein